MDYSHICYRESSIYENEMMSFAETSLLVENGIHCCLRNPRVSPFREFRKKKKKKNSFNPPVPVTETSGPATKRERERDNGRRT